MIDLFIPSYKRANNLKTVKLFKKLNYDMGKVHVFIDSEADDKEDYETSCDRFGCNLVVFDMNEARARYDYVHRASKSRRSAGQARNMFFDYAKKKGIEFYVVQDDDSNQFELKKKGKYLGKLEGDDVKNTFLAVVDFMKRHEIGCFGLSQTGDFIGGFNDKLLRWKVMNTTFYWTKYVYRGERGVQDDDTSQFVGMYNQGLFTGSLGDGVVLNQTPSATAKGGLTDLYNECKLLNKALVTVIQYPSAIKASYQTKNGGRIHHQITKKYLAPKLIKVGKNKRSNIAWNSYDEDYPFTNEPKRV